MPVLPRPSSLGRLNRQQQEQEQEARSGCDEEAPYENGKARLPAMASPRVPVSAIGTRSAVLSSRYALAGAVGALLLVAYSLGLGPFSGPREDPSALVFLSVGDFGTGSDSQLAVADQMANVAKEEPPRFILSLGDNVYDSGVQSADDPLLWKVFEDVYTHKSLQRPWLMALGDHDHRGSVVAQVAFSQRSVRWNMPAPYYRRSFSAGSGASRFTLDLFVTDSIALEALVTGEDPANRRFYHDYNLTLVGKKAGKRQLKWLKKGLKTSDADWKIVVGHRPVLTCGVRPRFPAEAGFAPLMQPLLEKYKVDAYLSGHDHVGQHLAEHGVQYYGSGVGGYGTHNAVANNLTLWVDSSYYGFMLHHVTKDQLVTKFIDKDGKVLHASTISHDPHDVEESRKLRL